MVLVIYDFVILDLDNILTELLSKIVLFSYDVICCIYIYILLLIIDNKKPDQFPREKMDKVDLPIMICLTAFSLFAMFIIIRELSNLFMTMV